MLLPVAPQILDRIQLRCVGREKLHCDASPAGFDVVSHQAAAMRRQLVPDHQQGLADLPSQGIQELHHLRGPNRARMKLEVKVPERDARHRRQSLPVEAVLEYRRLTPRRPSARPVRPLAEPAFVYEDDRPPFPEGFF